MRCVFIGYHNLVGIRQAGDYLRFIYRCESCGLEFESTHCGKHSLCQECDKKKVLERQKELKRKRESSSVDGVIRTFNKLAKGVPFTTVNGEKYVWYDRLVKEVKDHYADKE